MTTYNYMTYKMFLDKRYVDWDFRYKNILIYLSSDFMASFGKIFFEARKQILQMCNYDAPLQ